MPRGVRRSRTCTTRSIPGRDRPPDPYVIDRGERRWILCRRSDEDGDGMTLLNQIVAVETGIKSKTTRVVTDLHRLASNENLLNGRIKTYRPKDEDGDRYPPDNQPVQLRHSDALVTLAAELTKLFDVVLTKDVGNAGATASVSVPGRPTPLLADVPVTYLLFLEKQLTDLRTFVDKLPVLDPSVVWLQDPSSGDWRSEPAETVRTKKVP